MVKSDGADLGGYEYLWWVDYGGVHFPEVSFPGIYSARGNGAHFIFIIPTLDMVIVHRTDNDPPVKDAKTITEVANRLMPVSEILVAPGVEHAGAIPPEIQFVQVFCAAVVAGSTAMESAKRLIEFLASPHAAETIRHSGMEPAAMPR